MMASRARLIEVHGAPQDILYDHQMIFSVPHELARPFVRLPAQYFSHVSADLVVCMHQSAPEPFII